MRNPGPSVIFCPTLAAGVPCGGVVAPGIPCARCGAEFEPLVEGGQGHDAETVYDCGAVCAVVAAAVLAVVLVGLLAVAAGGWRP